LSKFLERTFIIGKKEDPFGWHGKKGWLYCCIRGPLGRFYKLGEEAQGGERVSAAHAWAAQLPEGIPIVPWRWVRFHFPAP